MIAMAITNVMINAIPDMNNLLMVFIQYTTGMDKRKNYVVYPVPKKKDELNQLLYHLSYAQVR